MLSAGIIYGIFAVLLLAAASLCIAHVKRSTASRKVRVLKITAVVGALAVATVAAIVLWPATVESMSRSEARVAHENQVQKEVEAVIKAKGLFPSNLTVDFASRQATFQVANRNRAGTHSLVALERNGKWVVACPYGGNWEVLEGSALASYNELGLCPVR